MSQFMNQPEQKSGKSFRAIISSVLFLALMFVGSASYSQTAQPTAPKEKAQESVHSVV